ncbi:MAG TPA: hypothetical protein VL857_01155, partial [Candidatus Eisenbacteria bacterium]|nr:hypothetical protein [Candidatus Eisenbacteria bacterium]
MSQPELETPVRRWTRTVAPLSAGVAIGLVVLVGLLVLAPKHKAGLADTENATTAAAKPAATPSVAANSAPAALDNTRRTAIVEA